MCIYIYIYLSLSLSIYIYIHTYNYIVYPRRPFPAMMWILYHLFCCPYWNGNASRVRRGSFAIWSFVHIGMEMHRA